jgi:hypothetical protein
MEDAATLHQPVMLAKEWRRMLYLLKGLLT